MEREQIWLIVLSVVLALVAIGGIVAVATLRADLDRLDRQLAASESGWEDETDDWSEPAPQPVSEPVGRIQDVAASTETLTLTISVRFSGPADLLYEPPVLQGDQGAYHPTQASLEQARFAFLSLASVGQVVTTFVFQPSPLKGETSLTLVFNPNGVPGDLVAPRWEMPIRKK